MTWTQRLVSAFIVFHLIAITIGATPSPDALPPAAAERSRPRTPGGTHGAVTRALDALVPPTLAVHHAFWTVTRPLHPIVRLYLSITRQYEQWNMFSRPPMDDEYMHLRYYVRSGTSSVLRLHRELVFPAHEEGAIRLFRGYSDSFRDKALALAFDRFTRRLASAGKQEDTARAEARAAEELFPIIDFFTRRFAERSLLPGEQVVRAELWWGLAPTRAPGEPPETTTLDARRRALTEYEPLTPTLRPADNMAPLGASVREADISWRLLSVRTWP